VLYIVGQQDDTCGKKVSVMRGYFFHMSRGNVHVLPPIVYLRAYGEINFY